MKGANLRGLFTIKYSLRAPAPLRSKIGSVIASSISRLLNRKTDNKSNDTKTKQLVVVYPRQHRSEKQINRLFTVYNFKLPHLA